MRSQQWAWLFVLMTVGACDADDLGAADASVDTDADTEVHDAGTTPDAGALDVQRPQDAAVDAAPSDPPDAATMATMAASSDAEAMIDPPDTPSGTPSESIPVRFVGLSRASEQVTSDLLLFETACPIEARGPGEIVLTECITRTLVDLMNLELERLTGQRPFEFDSYTCKHGDRS